MKTTTAVIHGLGRFGDTMDVMHSSSTVGVFVDGKSRFTTGQFVPYAGGWA